MRRRIRLELIFEEDKRKNRRLMQGNYDGRLPVHLNTDIQFHHQKTGYYSMSFSQAIDSLLTGINRNESYKIKIEVGKKNEY